MRIRLLIASAALPLALWAALPLQSDGSPRSSRLDDLLERGEFMRRVSEQDQRIIGIVRAARADATSTEARLQRLARRQRRVTALVLFNRDQIVTFKQQLIGT